MRRKYRGTTQLAAFEKTTCSAHINQYALLLTGRNRSGLLKYFGGMIKGDFATLSVLSYTKRQLS